MASNDFELGHDAAVAKVDQAGDILTQVKATLKRWQDEGEEMTTGSWMGASASKFSTTTGEHASEFQTLTNKLDETMQIARTAMGHLASADQG